MESVTGKVREVREDGGRLVLVGGDGAVHFALNAAPGPIEIGLVPTGRANNIARALGITQLPHVVVETQWTLAGMHSQNDYVEALRQIHGEWSSEEPG